MSLEVIENGTIRKLGYSFLIAFRNNSPVSLAVSTQYTNVTDTQLDTARQQEPRYAASAVARQKIAFWS